MLTALRAGMAGALKVVLRISASVAAIAITVALLLGVVVPVAMEAANDISHLNDPDMLSRLATLVFEGLVAAVFYVVTLKLCIHGAATANPGMLIGSAIVLYVSGLVRNSVLRPAPPLTGWLVSVASGVAYASLAPAVVAAFVFRALKPRPPRRHRVLGRHQRPPPPPHPIASGGEEQRQPRPSRARTRPQGAGMPARPRPRAPFVSRDFVDGILRSGVPGIAGHVSRISRSSKPFTPSHELLSSFKGGLPGLSGCGGEVTCWLVGCGGWGCVYECVYGGREFALKIHRLFRDVVEGGRAFLGELPTAPESVLRRVESEVKVLARLTHPNLVAVLAYSTSFPAVAYEFVWGGPLRRYLGLIRGGVKPALTVGIQVGDALRYLHSRGVVHGDIKPGNILVRRDGGLKVGDYSSVRRLIETASASGGTVCTPGYCAPEQVFSDLLRKAVDAGMENRVDIYQLGNLMLETLTGEVLDGREVVRNPGRVGELLKGVACADLASLIEEMMSPDPRDRPSAEEVVRRAATLLKSGCGGP